MLTKGSNGVGIFQLGKVSPKYRELWKWNFPTSFIFVQLCSSFPTLFNTFQLSIFKLSSLKAINFSNFPTTLKVFLKITYVMKVRTFQVDVYFLTLNVPTSHFFQSHFTTACKTANCVLILQAAGCCLQFSIMVLWCRNESKIWVQNEEWKGETNLSFLLY